MKKLFVLLCMALGLPFAEAQAAGPYDGIWSLSYFGIPIGYYSVHENGGMLLAVSLPDGSAWDAAVGTRNGSAVTLTWIVGNADGTASVVFPSATTLSATQTSCTPKVAGVRCLPNGSVVQGIKIF